MTNGVTRINSPSVNKVVIRLSLDGSIAQHGSIVGEVPIVAVEYCTCGDVDYTLITKWCGNFQLALLYVHGAGVFECSTDDGLVGAVCRANRFGQRPLIDEGAVSKVSVGLNIKGSARTVGKAATAPVADATCARPGARTIVDNTARACTT